VVRGRAKHAHVAARRQGILRVHAEHAEGGVQSPHALGLCLTTAAPVRGAAAAPLPQWCVGEDADHVVRHAMGDGEGGVLHHDARRRAADVHARQQPQIGQAQVVLKVQSPHARQGRYPLVHQQAVDVVFLEARVFQGEADRLGGEPSSAVTVDAAHLGYAEPRDGGPALQIAACHSCALMSNCVWKQRDHYAGLSGRGQDNARPRRRARPQSHLEGRRLRKERRGRPADAYGRM
jgi:hypothetical protein